MTAWVDIEQLAARMPLAEGYRRSVQTLATFVQRFGRLLMAAVHMKASHIISTAFALSVTLTPQPRPAAR